MELPGREEDPGQRVKHGDMDRKAYQRRKAGINLWNQKIIPRY